MTNETLFQQLVENNQANEMADDLEGVDWEEVEKLEVALPVHERDVDRITEELREIADDQQ